MRQVCLPLSTGYLCKMTNDFRLLFHSLYATICKCSAGDADASIRVWRSLVSRLNGVQEALSSNLNTRRPKPLKSKDLGGFFNFYGSEISPKKFRVEYEWNRCGMGVANLVCDVQKRVHFVFLILLDI